MFIKKRKLVLFIVLSLFAFIAFAANTCRAEEWTIQIANDFDYISPTGERRINIIGTECQREIQYGDVYVTAFQGDGEQKEPFPMDPIIDQPFSGGQVTAHIIIPLETLFYDPADQSSSVTEVKIFVIGDVAYSDKICPTDYATPTVVSLVVGDGFAPSDGTDIYNFFNCYVDAEDNEYGTPLDDPVLLSFQGLGDADQVAVDSGGFSDKAELLLDFWTYVDDNLISSNQNYDYKIVYTDRAGNAVTIPRNNIKAFKYIDAVNDENALTGFPSGLYTIKFPLNMLTTIGTNVAMYVVNGKQLTPGQSWIDTVADPDYDFLVIGGTDIANLGLTPENWTLDNQITVAHWDGAGYDYAFGVNDGVGPRLLRSEVIDDLAETHLTFSEPLKDNVLSALDIMTKSCQDGVLGSCLCLESLTIDPTNPNCLILGRMLDNNEEVWVDTHNDTSQDIMDEQGNLAQHNHVFTITSRKLESIKVTALNWALQTTTIEITFNDLMDNSTPAIQTPATYSVEQKPGLVPKPAPNEDQAQVISAVLSVDKTTVTLTVGGVIEKTDAANLPRVTIVNPDGITGDTGGTLRPPFTLTTEDTIGAYIRTATYDENGYYTPAPDWHGQKTPRTDNKLVITFSEPVNRDDIETCLDNDCWPFEINNGSPIGPGAEVMNVNGDAYSIEIRMGLNNTANPDIPDQIQIKTLNSLFDLADPPNSASIQMYILIEDKTLPYIIEVKTVDAGGIVGALEALTVEFNEVVDFNKYWNVDPLLMAPLMAEVGGVSIQLRDRLGVYTGGSWNPQHTIFTITLPESQFTDTGATPELTIYFDGKNWLEDLNGNTVQETVTVPESRVIDDADPRLVLAEYQLDDDNTCKYMITVHFSELIDPDVWLNPDDTLKAVDDIFDITAGAGYTVNAADCAFDPIEMSVREPRTNLKFTLVAVGGCAADLANPPNTLFESDPPDFEVDNVTQTVWDLNGYYAPTGDVQEAVLYTPPPSDVDTAALYPPKFKTNVAMVVQGTVSGIANPAAVGDLVVAAYTEDDLFHYSNNPLDYTSWQIDHPDDEVFMALPGPKCTCLGSTNVQTDGMYCIIVYGNDGQAGHETAFEAGANKPVFLVLIDASDGDGNPLNDPCYLVSGGVQADADFYRPFVDSYHDGMQTYDIDLARQERISLYKGWNLVSTSVKKNYHLAGPAVAPQALCDGSGPISIPAVEMEDVNYVFSSIRNQWGFISTYDAATTTNLSDMNEDLTAGEEPIAELPFFSVGYGYWIYVPTVNKTTLTIFGDVIDTAENQANPYHLPLVANEWNLVGHWGGQVKHTVCPLNSWFSSALETKHNVAYVENIFGFSDGNCPVLQARGYRMADNTGMLTWYANPPVPTLDLNLNYAGPGCGYCLKIEDGAACVLTWDHP